MTLHRQRAWIAAAITLLLPAAVGTTAAAADAKPNILFILTDDK